MKLASPLLPLISCDSLKLVLVDEDTYILPLGGPRTYMTVKGDIVRVSLPTFSALDRKGIPERVLFRVVGAEVGNPVEPPSACSPIRLLRARALPLELRGEYKGQHSDGI